MTAPTLLTALTRLPGRTRETLSHLLIDLERGTTACVPDPDHGDQLEGPLTQEVPLLEQLQALAGSGLWGRVLWEEAAGTTMRVQLWADDREAWRKRLLLAGRSQAALAALEAGGDLKLATWRRESAMARLRDQVHHADAAGIGRTDLITLTQIARSTLYGFFKDAPQVEHGSGGPDVAWLPQSAAEATPPAQVPAPRTPTPAAPRRGGPDELVRMPTGHTAPCVVCGTPATATLGEHPVHPAECLRALRENNGQPPIRPSDPAVPAAAPDAPPAPANPAPVPAPARPAHRGARTRPAAREPRFAAVAAALDADWLYLPGGEVHPWSAEHLGDVAMLVDEYRLGHGGGATLPDRGEVWLYPGALERLGLPHTVDIDMLNQASVRAEQTRTRYRELNDVPVVAAALAEGWELAGDRMDQRTRISHPQRLRAGAHLVTPTWSHLKGIPLFVDDDGEFLEPAALVERLQSFADAIGIAFRITPGVTGLDLVDHTRPPRRSALDDDGQAITVVRDEAPQLPPFLKDWHDSRMTQLETNFSWWRDWTSLTDSERGHEWVHAYDHRSHFLNPWGSTDLGVEGLIHLEGEDARWDGTENAGYYRVSRWEPIDWTMPDPINALRGISEGTVWLTPHSLKQLEKLSPGMTDTLTYHEAWIWEVHARYLAKAGKILTVARAEAPQPVADTVKELYAAATQKFASRDGRPNYHLRRPDWRDHIISSSRTAIIAALIAARDRSGATPLVVDRDTIIYASDDPDPRSAWPGDPAKYGQVSGGWRAIGSARLAEWGPDALKPKAGAWRYNQHMQAMKAVNQ